MVSLPLTKLNLSISQKTRKDLRTFLDGFASQHKIKLPFDWGKISPQSLIKNGPGNLLSRFGFSMLKLLEFAYPEVKWEQEWFTEYKKTIEKQKILLNTIAKKLNISSPKDWGNISQKQFIEQGGKVLLNFYNGSIPRLLQTLFQETEWKSEWFINTKVNKRTKRINIQKEFLEKFALLNGIKNPSDWNQVALKEIKKHDAPFPPKKIELIKALKRAYPGFKIRPNSNLLETKWEEICYVKNRRIASKGYWNSPTARRAFWDNLAKELNIKTHRDWGKYGTNEIVSKKGKIILNRFSGSIFLALQDAYPETEWRFEWFQKLPKNYWDSVEHQKAFFNNMAIKLGVKSPRDWGNISYDDFLSRGGGSILLRSSAQFRNNLFGSLKFAFPEIKWKQEWFKRMPRRYWNNKENQRRIFDSIAKQLNIKKPIEWGNLNHFRIKELGGRKTLTFYGNSLFRALQNIYSEISWERKWFVNVNKFPPTHWNSMQNQRRFLDSIADTYGINSIEDWKKVSLVLIRKQGGMGLLRKYSNSLNHTLSSVYKGRFNWDPSTVSLNQKEVLFSVNEILG